MFRIPCGEGGVVHYIEPGFVANVAGNVLDDGNSNYLASCDEQLFFEPQYDNLKMYMEFTTSSANVPFHQSIP